MSIVCRGVRGATTVKENSREAILTATRQMLALLVRRNELNTADIASAIFTVTRDVNAEFPPWPLANWAGWKFHSCVATKSKSPARCPCAYVY